MAMTPAAVAEASAAARFDAAKNQFLHASPFLSSLALQFAVKGVGNVHGDSHTNSTPINPTALSSRQTCQTSLPTARLQNKAAQTQS